MIDERVKLQLPDENKINSEVRKLLIFVTL